MSTIAPDPSTTTIALEKYNAEVRHKAETGQTSDDYLTVIAVAGKTAAEFDDEVCELRAQLADEKAAAEASRISHLLPKAMATQKQVFEQGESVLRIFQVLNEALGTACIKSIEQANLVVNDIRDAVGRLQGRRNYWSLRNRRASLEDKKAELRSAKLAVHDYARQPDSLGHYVVNPLDSWRSEVARLEAELVALEKPLKFVTTAKVAEPVEFQSLDVPAIISKALLDAGIEKSAIQNFAEALLTETKK